MPVTKDQLRAQLQRREFAPVYLLFGPEVYLRERAEKTIVDLAFGPDDFRDFNDTTFTLGGDVNLASALAAARQLPMMSARRIVRVRDVRITLSGFRDTVTEDDEPAIRAYLENPPPETILILIADELSGVRKIGKLLRERTMAVDFQRMDDREVARWVDDEMRRSDINPERRVATQLLDRVGSDLFRLSNEIKKLATATLPSSNITDELIDELVPVSRELSNFQLTDHLVGGRRAKAMNVLKRILDGGAEPLALLGLLSYNYRCLLIAKEMMQAGSDRTEISRSLKGRPQDQEFILAAARRADPKLLAHAIQRLADTDVAIKNSVGGGGVAGARLLLETLVCELALAVAA